jgi:hypothetical protein
VGDTTGSELTGTDLIFTEPRYGAFTISNGTFCNVRIALDDEQQVETGMQHVLLSTTTQDNPYCIAIGSETLKNTAGNFADIAIGAGCLRDYTGTNSYNNIAIGASMVNMVTGHHCIGIRFNTLSGDGTGDGCSGTIAIGAGAAQSLTSDTDSVYLGRTAGRQYYGVCSNNIVILASDTVGTNVSNVIRIGNNGHIELKMGNIASYKYSDGNTAFGTAMPPTASGSANTMIGNINGSSLYAGSNNTGIGNQALQSVTNGNSNTAVGTSALRFITNGSENICMGFYAGSNYTTTESNNIIIGHFLQGTIGESDILRIGGTQTKAFIAGIRGVTTVNADAIPVLIDSAGQLGTVI